ncbi:MAG: sodium:solute symporter family protein [Desulfitobacterium hafniense]|nr:sodium:solute symporter family protein [Desulfitobacterium hafniense]
MNSFGFWILGLCLIYTLVIIVISRYARKKAEGGDGYWVGGRSFKPWMVFVCITGLFSGSSFISILELSYKVGISAGWYGVAEMLHVLIIALLLIAYLRKLKMVTVSGLIGDRFGRAALGVSGMITAFTFPMWSVATALAFASALHVFTNLSLPFSIAITGILLLIFLQAGGMWSVVVTQTANSIAFAAMFIVGSIALFINPGISGLAQLAATKPEMFSLTNAGLQTIIAWFATFLINVVVAQAAFQMALSCRTPEEGRKGLLMAFGANIFFVVFGVLFGLAAAAVAPGGARGMIAVPLYLAQVLPAPLVGVFFLGIWAAALGWGAPCQFSGSTSLGRDVMGAIDPTLSDERKVTYTKYALVILTIVMILLGLMRSSMAAWWNVLAWTLRNGATFAPVVAALAWPLATRRAAVAALVGGFASGLTWYALGGWDPVKFFYNIHPVFIGMTFNILLMVFVTLVGKYGQWKVSFNQTSGRKTLGMVGLTVIVLLSVLVATQFNWLFTKGLIGLTLFLVVVSFFVNVLVFTEPIGAKTEIPEKAYAK